MTSLIALHKSSGPFASLSALSLVLLQALVSPRLVAAADGPPASFQADTLAAWAKPVGEWAEAKGVSSDSADSKRFMIVPGSGVLVNGAKGRTSNLVSEALFDDVEAHIEFVVPEGSNSGVYFMGRYEVQILDSHGKTDIKYGDCGGLYASCSEPKPDWPGKPPAINVSKAPGQWQTFDVIFRAPRFDASGKKTENARFVKVSQNGRVIHENIEVPRPTCAALSLDEKPRGPLMLQGDHGPVAFRNIQLTRGKY